MPLILVFGAIREESQSRIAAWMSTPLYRKDYEPHIDLTMPNTFPFSYFQTFLAW